MTLPPLATDSGDRVHVACREEMALPEFTAIAELEYPELHDESIPTLTFAKAVQRLLAASGVRDFMLKVLCTIVP